MSVIYIDSLALLNFIINYLLLLVSARISGVSFKRLRIAGGALLGAAYAVAIWLPGLAFLSGWLWKIVFCLLMVFIAAGFQNPGQAVRAVLTFVAASFLLGGVVLALGMLSGNPSPGGIPYVPVDFRTLFLTAGLSYALLTLVFRHMARHGVRDTAEVCVAWEDRCIRVTALIDSGHTLVDPIGGAEVLIVDAAAAIKLLPPRAETLTNTALLRDPANMMELMGTLGLGVRFRLIPFQTVDTRCGFILAFRPDSVTVGNKPRKNCLIGLSPAPISAGAGINALISVS